MRKGTPSLTLVEQWMDARRAFRNVRLTRSGMVLPLRPSLESATYQIRLDYKPERSPRVFVISPPLVAKPPHVYRGGNLCLYWQEFVNSMSVAETIIPWTAEWLFFYELWQTTGEWLAPESPHQGPK